MRVFGKIANDDFLRILVLVITLTVSGFMIISFDPYNNYDINYGISVFFGLISINRNVVFTIVYFIALPFVQLTSIYLKFENKFDNTITTRISLRKYYFYCIRKIAMNTFIFTTCTYLALLSMIHIYWSSVSFVPQHIFPLFSEKTIQNIVLFLITSTIGNILFSLFLFSIMYYFKDRYSFSLFPVVLVLSSIIICMFLTFLLSPLVFFINDASLIKSLAFSLSPLSIIMPGLLFESSGMSEFIFGTFTYSILTFLFLNLSSKRRLING